MYLFVLCLFIIVSGKKNSLEKQYGPINVDLSVIWQVNKTENAQG